MQIMIRMNLMIHEKDLVWNGECRWTKEDATFDFNTIVKKFSDDNEYN